MKFVVYKDIKLNNMIANVTALEFPFKSYVSVRGVNCITSSLITCINTSDQQFAVIYSKTST